MKAKCLFFTGLPCSGKTTIVKSLEKYYPNVRILDGDEIRGTPLAKNVGFSPEDRKNHILRMGQLAKMFVDNGVTVLCSFVSPQKEVRDEVRAMFDDGEFNEIYVSTPLEECVDRDVKKMYAKAIAGEIKNFTGISAPYEAPEAPELALDTSKLDLDTCVREVLNLANLFDKPAAFYIGRWNSVLHLSHEHIFNQSLDQGKKIVLLIRNVKPDENNPWTAKEVKEMIDYRYVDNPLVETVIIPDVSDVLYGRGVGYNVEQIKVTKKVAGISGTKCRELIANNDPEWKKYMHPRTVEFLEKKYGNKKT